MATSGTVGQTVIPVSRLLEKAIRRCGLSPASLTAETVSNALETMFMFTMSLTNRGLNLWCIEQAEIPLVAGQAAYVLPAGTLDVLNVLLMVPAGDGNGYRDIPITQFNRDEYAVQPNKNFQSPQPTNYWFEKLVTPRLTLWPVPSDATRKLRVFVHRQPQDVGTLTNELDIPSRWLEAYTWHLALRLAFELPGVSAERLAAVQAMVQGMTLEVEGGETDSSSTYFAPGISVYTR